MTDIDTEYLYPPARSDGRILSDADVRLLRLEFRIAELVARTEAMSGQLRTQHLAIHALEARIGRLEKESRS